MAQLTLKRAHELSGLTYDEAAKGAKISRTRYFMAVNGQIQLSRVEQRSVEKFLSETLDEMADEVREAGAVGSTELRKSARVVAKGKNDPAGFAADYKESLSRPVAPDEVEAMRKLQRGR